ncbi:hypothetical protein CAG69_13055 [Vibrio sp. V43_P6S15P86]|uniref:YecA family protein n=1 Tax=Vibrio sp. V43_P6S15P86 TaxID=1938694 RepID=UPI0013854E75|nr:SEC-C domain-containing protein [Vibrio sp. V43_P6S15P86]NAW82958.1 hypothetical protein [Vibrio sp. V43_P6S15P86]
MMKVGRNEPCWCGSGKKYKKCHLSRHQEEKYSLSRLLGEFKKRTQHKECLHPQASKETCSKKVIDAHSIQKSGPLKRITDSNNHVCTFSPSHQGGFELESVGWKKASTFKGFCSKHDKAFFACIEDEEFTNSPEQCFVAGYRSYALEYFKKIRIIKGLPFVGENIDRGLTVNEQQMLQAQLLEMKSGFLKGVDDFKETLEFYTDNFARQNYSSFSSMTFHFKGSLNVVLSGCFSTEFTVQGKRLQSLEPSTPFIENISINTLVTDEGHAIVFSWPKHFESCKAFAESLLEVHPSSLPTHLIELMFSYIENTYFSEAWFGTLSSDEKARLKKLASNPCQYGTPVTFSSLRYVDWEFERVICH